MYEEKKNNKSMIGLGILIFCIICLGTLALVAGSSPSTSYDYTTQVHNAIFEIFPDASFSFTNFREWEAEGITMQENSFTYKNEFNIECESTYLARGCMGEIFYLRIDDTVVYSDPDRAMELMEQEVNNK